MPKDHNRRADAPGCDESDELIGLVEVVLRLDIVFAIGGFADELELGGEGYWGGVEGDEPDGEDLGDVDVEEEGCFVECWNGSSLASRL